MRVVQGVIREEEVVVEESEIGEEPWQEFDRGEGSSSS